MRTRRFVVVPGTAAYNGTNVIRALLSLIFLRTARSRVHYVPSHALNDRLNARIVLLLLLLLPCAVLRGVIH